MERGRRDPCAMSDESACFRGAKKSKPETCAGLTAPGREGAPASAHRLCSRVSRQQAWTETKNLFKGAMAEQGFVSQAGRETDPKGQTRTWSVADFESGEFRSVGYGPDHEGSWA